MSLKISGTTVINDSRALENISNLKTVGGQAILGTGDIPFPSSAPSSHVGSTGTAHGVATTSVAGFMSSADKTKLDGIATGANNYTHPTGDGNLHVPATGTTNNGKVLKAGSTAGSISWGNISFLEVESRPTTLSGYGITDAASSAHSHSNATTSVSGFMSSADKAKLDGIATGATVNSTDAQLRDRSTHTGAQAISTITGLQTALDGKSATTHVHSNATPSVAGFMSNADKTKLDGIATGANNYTHPTNHPASIITQDANNRFVTDAEKTSWNAKVDASSVQTLTNKTISGGVYSGVVDVGGSVRTNVITVPALDINCSLGNYFVKTINANSTFTFSNAPASKAYSFIIEIQHQSGTITWPSSVKWPYNRLPTLTTNRTHIFSFITYNGGQSWRGSCNPDYLN